MIKCSLAINKISIFELAVSLSLQTRGSLIDNELRRRQRKLRSYVDKLRFLVDKTLAKVRYVALLNA